MLLLSSDDTQALAHSLPALADLPTAGMPLAAGAAALPALGWQAPAARAAVQQLLAAGDWLRVSGSGQGGRGWRRYGEGKKQKRQRLPCIYTASFDAAIPGPNPLPSNPRPQARVGAAQYAHLPLASIGPDWIIDTADALYARQLRERLGCFPLRPLHLLRLALWGPRQSRLVRPALRHNCLA